MEFLRKIKNRILTAMFTFAVYACFRVKVEYEDPDQKNNPPQGIYICNHMALFDGFLVRAVVRKIKLYSLITTKWYDKTWARQLLFFENCIPVDTDNPGTKWLRDALEVLKSGDSISIFPEGHASRSDDVNEFRPGFLLLAQMAKGIPIIPVATVGRYSFFFGERKRVLIGRPVVYDRNRFMAGSGGQEEYAAYFRDIILQMRERLKEEIR